MLEILQLITNNPEIYITILLSLEISSNIKSVLKNCKLNRNSKYNGKNIIAPQNVVEELYDTETFNINTNNSIFGSNKLLKKFIEKLGEHVSKEDLKIASKNLVNVKIERSINPILRGASGSYYSYKNLIEYSFIYSITHELLHASSTICTRELELVGFKQGNNLTEIGRGINEGYTELINSKIFNKGIPTGYYSLVKIASLLEYFFDNPKEMQHLYFTANLPGLIKQIQKYSSREEAFDIIFEIDKLYNYSRNNNLLLEDIFSAKLQVRLYKVFSKCSDKNKVEEFRKKVLHNPLAAIIINRQKPKLQRENIYNNTNKSL